MRRRFVSTAGAPAIPLPLRVIPPLRVGRGRARLLVERNVVAYRRGWIFLVSGFFEPLFYLMSIGLGLNHLVGHSPSAPGRSLHRLRRARSARFFGNERRHLRRHFRGLFKLKIAKTYDAVLRDSLGFATSPSELSWSLIRGTVYSIAFLAVMAALGLIASWWAVLCLPPPCW